MIRRRAATAAILALPLAIAAARPEFTSTWLAPDGAGVSFAGKKVAALVMSSDQSLRVSGEEQLVRELAARGVHGVATYRMAPSEELTSADRARPWFERAAVEGVVALRPVSADKQVIYSPSVWTTTSYTTLWGYYGYGWSGVYSPGSSRTDRIVVVETLVYSVALDKLLWAGASTTTNPADLQTFVKDLVSEAVKEMKKQRLVR